MRVLPNNIRHLLKEPVGQLVNERELIKRLRSEKYIVSIGDIVTYTILKNEIKPIICIIDYKTRRGKVSSEIVNTIKSFGKKNILINNPAATISDELWNILEKSLKNYENISLRIEIDGEEDLASLAVVYLAPSDVTIIYGLPDKGVLIIKPTSENKKKAKQILDKM